MSRSERNVVGAVIMASMIVLHACAKTHGPHDSTETGNPPVIDADRVALMVRDGEPHVVGEKGAVTPGGVTITVRNLVSDKRASSAAAKDGSFDVKAPGGVNDGFSVQASNGDGRSKLVFVTSAGTIEGDGKNGALSCEQQTMISEVQTRAATMAADTSCAQDDDCVEADTDTVCWDSCDYPAVSQTGKMLLDSFVASINQGVCSGYADAGCQTGVRFCNPHPPPHLACMQGHCVHVDADAGAGDSSSGAGDAGSDGGASMCESIVNMAMDELKRAIADADRTCSTVDDCVRAPWTSDCFGGCPFDFVSAAGEMQVQAAVQAINSGVCASFDDAGCKVDGMGPPHSCPAVVIPKPSCKENRCVADPSCADRESEAATQLALAIGSADNSCSTNADCVMAPLATDCFAGCYDVALSDVGAASVQDAINSGVCADAVAAGCGGPITCLPPTMPTCNRGRCEPLLDCQDRFSAAQTRIRQVAEAADKTCSKDADCDFAASAADCGGGCGYGAILPAKGRADVAAAIAELNTGVCKDFAADGCMPPMASCAPRPTPVCNNGQCSSTPAP